MDSFQNIKHLTSLILHIPFFKKDLQRSPVPSQPTLELAQPSTPASARFCMPLGPHPLLASSLLQKGSVAT